MAWAFATLIHADQKLFGAFAGTAMLRMKGMANMAWAFAKLSPSDEEAVCCIGEGSPTADEGAQCTKGIANMAWAFAKTSPSDEGAVRARSALLPGAGVQCTGYC